MATKRKPNIVQAFEDSNLFGSLIKNQDTWGNWKILLKAMFALPLTGPELEIYRKFTGREKPPAEPFKEVWTVIGRGGGKSFISAISACYMALFEDWELGPGEVGNIMCFATDRKQARVVMDYIKEILSIPLFAKFVIAEKAEEIELKGNLRITITTATHRAPRGFSILCAVCDEIAFWHSEGSSPGREILRALRPGLARVKGSKLIAISTPYSQTGPLFETHRDKYGQEDSHSLVWAADTLSMNPTFNKSEISRALQEDHPSARAEYFVEFRADVQGFLDPAAVDACVIPDRRELPFREGVKYSAFCDPSGGRADDFTLAISSFDKENQVVILEKIEARTPPFRPADVTKEYAGILRDYKISTVTGDKYAGSWPSDEFSKHGIKYIPSALSKSELYLELGPIINQGSIEILNNTRLVEQLKGLQRRVGRSGKDSVDHFPGGHDDLANVLAGCCVGVPKRPVRKGRVAAYGGYVAPPREEEYEFPSKKRSRVFVGATSGKSHLKYKSYKENSMFTYQWTPSERYTQNFLDHRGHHETDKGMKQMFAVWVQFVNLKVQDLDEINETKLEAIAEEMEQVYTFKEFNANIKKRDRQKSVLNAKLVCETILKEHLRPTFFYNHILNAYKNPKFGTDAATIK